MVEVDDTMSEDESNVASIMDEGMDHEEVGISLFVVVSIYWHLIFIIPVLIVKKHIVGVMVKPVDLISTWVVGNWKKEVLQNICDLVGNDQQNGNFDLDLVDEIYVFNEPLKQEVVTTFTKTIIMAQKEHWGVTIIHVKN